MTLTILTLLPNISRVQVSTLVTQFTFHMISQESHPLGNILMNLILMPYYSL